MYDSRHLTVRSACTKHAYLSPRPHTPISMTKAQTIDPLELATSPLVGLAREAVEIVISHVHIIVVITASERAARFVVDIVAIWVANPSSV